MEIELKKLMGRFNGLMIDARPRDFLRLGYHDLFDYWYIYHSNEIEPKDIYEKVVHPIEELLDLQITFKPNNFSDTKIEIDITWIQAIKKANKKLRKEIKEYTEERILMSKMKRKGQLCPRCGKGKLEKVKECKNRRHKCRNELICRTCKLTNF